MSRLTAEDYCKQAKEWVEKERDRLAIDCYDQALSLLDGFPDKQAEIHLEMGHLWRGLGKNKQTGNHYSQALALYEAKHGKTAHEGTATALFCLGSFLDQIFKPKPAKDYYARSLKMMTVIHGPTHDIPQAIQKKLEKLMFKLT